jgi:hypothetical protein
VSNEKVNSSTKQDIKNKISKAPTSEKLSQNKKADIRKLNGVNRPPGSNKSHVKAPFQTNPSLSFPKHSTNQEAMTKGTRSKKFVPRGVTKYVKGAPAAGQVSQGQSAGQVNQGQSAGQVNQGQSAGQVKPISQGDNVETQTKDKDEIETKKDEKFEMDDTSPNSRQKTVSEPALSSRSDSNSVNVEKHSASVRGATVKEEISEPEPDDRFRLLKNGYV